MTNASTLGLSLTHWCEIACETPLFLKAGFGGRNSFSGGSDSKNPPAMQETQEMRVRSLGQEDPLQEGMATHSSILAWRIPGTEESGGLQSMGSQRVGQD